MKLFSGIIFILISSPAYPCTFLESQWTCENTQEENLLLEIKVDDIVTYKQTRMGIDMGPLSIDGQQHSTIDSSKIKMEYIGNCTSEESMVLKIEQIYLGGFKVRFDQNLTLVSKKELKLEILNYKAGSEPTVKHFFCSRNPS